MIKFSIRPLYQIGNLCQFWTASVNPKSACASVCVCLWTLTPPKRKNLEVWNFVMVLMLKLRICIKSWTKCFNQKKCLLYLTKYFILCNKFWALNWYKYLKVCSTFLYNCEEQLEENRGGLIKYFKIFPSPLLLALNNILELHFVFNTPCSVKHVFLCCKWHKPKICGIIIIQENRSFHGFCALTDCTALTTD